MKLTLLSALLFNSFILFAQIKKGAILIGGDISFSGNSSKAESLNQVSDSKYSGFSFSPVVGVAIKDNLFAGAGLSYSNIVQKQTSINNNQESNAKIKTNNYGAQVWIRKYYPLSKSFYLFLNGSLGAVVGRRNDKNIPNAFNNITSNSFNISIIVYPGLSYQMKKNFFLDASINNLASLSFQQEKIQQKNIDGSSSSRTNRNYNFYSTVGNGTNPLQIGVRWIIAK